MIRTGIIIAIIVFIGSLVLLYISTPIQATPGLTATSSSFIDKMASSPQSTSTLRRIDATIVSKTSLFLNNVLLSISDWLDSLQGHGTLRRLQDTASTSLSNLICTPESANFVCDNGGDRFQPPEFNVCGCVPTSCKSTQHIKITSHPNDFWSNGTIKGKFECVDN